jgi:glucose-6-phosphate 1-dehydrogenase
MEPPITPSIITILGVTGDLAQKKILPALFNLYRKGMLPDRARIVGFGRRQFTSEEFAAYVQGAVEKRILNARAEDLTSFCELLSYVEGDFFSGASYGKLSDEFIRLEREWGDGSTRTVYLAVPPDLYEPIFTNLHASSIYQEKQPGHFRLLVEKPFGSNEETAEKLEQLLAGLFAESEIYRIDHYLAKEMVQNILAFRFANDLFEQTWNKDAIEKVEIKLWETLGVEQRGAFYDGVGALRDVGQNHILQLLALLTMERPQEWGVAALRAKRAELLEKLVPPAAEDMPTATYRGQYSGYQAIAGVASGSETETFFKVRAYLQGQRWEGVPFVFEGGKRVQEQIKEIIVTYRHTEPCWCEGGEHRKNRIRFLLEPEEGIRIDFVSKEPGLRAGLRPRSIDFMLRSSGESAQYVEEYEKLFLDAMRGDQTLFVSGAEVRAMWRFVDPIIASWQAGSVPLSVYEPDTFEAPEQAAYI